jgi:hypothetical protein
LTFSRLHGIISQKIVLFNEEVVSAYNEEVSITLYKRFEIFAVVKV